MQLGVDGVNIRLLLLGDAVDCYEVVLFMVEWFPWIIAANVIALGVVKPGYRVLTFLSFPIVLLSLIAAILIGSHTEANRNGFEFGATSVREALETYIEKERVRTERPTFLIFWREKSTPPPSAFTK